MVAPSFKAEWQRLAPAREFAATLLRYRAEHGFEFVLDVSPADRKPLLVTARAQKPGAIAHDDVSVSLVAGSSSVSHPYSAGASSPAKRRASWVRDFTSSLRNTFRRWYSTVLGLMKS
jgi:hypothetical protein